MDLRARRNDWSDDNALGLAYAADGAWSDAADAFASAVDVASSRSDVAAHEALALVLNNLAQACFRVGRVDDALHHGQRACTLRAALFGEDAIAVARARADLAVMLGSAGRTKEGLGLMSRAIGGFERTAGDEDLRLSSLLENAARLALMAGEPSTAEPYLIRLHALLALHEHPTDVAVRLLTRVASYRESDRPPVSVQQFTETQTTVETVDAMLEVNDADDFQPTPDAEPAAKVLTRTPSAPLRGVHFDLIDHHVAESTAAVTMGDAVDASTPNDVFGDAACDLVDLLPPTPVHDAVRHERSSEGASPADVLGFVVEYGASDDPMRPDLTEMTVESPLRSARVRTPSIALHLPSQPNGPATSAVTPLSASNHRDFDSRPVRPQITETPQASTREPDPASNAQPQGDDLEMERRSRRLNGRAGRASAPRSSRGLLIAGIVTTAIAASVAWLLRSGGA